MDTQTYRWWTGLRVVSVINLALLAITLILVPLDSGVVRLQALCAVIYTVVCAFRSFRPRVDLERTVLIDEPLSAIALGRTSATIAEMAFTVQLALFVDALAVATGVAWAVPIAWSLVPLIAVAQTCCWLGVLTLDHRWHAAEEALWAAMMVLLCAVFVAAAPSTSGITRALLPVGLGSCAIGAYVMVVMDMPMYFRRYREEVAAGTRFLGLGEGVRDAMSRRVQTGDWEVWRHEVAWMTPYFSAGVWLSLVLVWIA